MGNICRSPMAERLLRQAAVELVGDKADELLLSQSAGTGGWHAGEAMNPPAAREVRRRGGDDSGFLARKLRGEHIDSADLILTATAEQVDFVVGLRPDAGPRTFVFGELGRLLEEIDAGALPVAAPQPDAVLARGVALVEAADVARAGLPPRPEDELDDPWGRGDSFFSRVAGEIDATVRPLATVLLG
jgi:protein-tyrosine phosphatase